MKKLVEISKLSTGYNSHIVLEDINFTVFQNDFIGIIGPNGGGKTSLLKVILGVLKPWEGKVQYHFSSSQKIPDGAIGYLPQVNSFDAKFPISVKEVVLSGLLNSKRLIQSYSRADKLKADAYLEKFGLRNITGQVAGELSGGQLQRTFLARAMIASPKLLILDEPNSYVDNKFEYELYSMLKEINKDAAILLVSHDVGMISSYIKTIACVNKTLHYHPSNEISEEQLKVYNCPIDIITHGTVPHRVLHKH